MRILIVGSNAEGAIELFYQKHLANTMGVSIQLFPSQSLLYLYLSDSIFNRISLRFGNIKILKEINYKLINFVFSFKPDIVWVFKGMEILPDTIRKIKELGILVGNYNPDNPFIFTGRGSGNSNIKESLTLYDFHFTYNQDVLNRLIKLRRTNVFYLPFGFEIEDTVSDEIILQPELHNTLCFIGNGDSEREKFIRGIVARNIPIHIYGSNWKLLPSKNLRVFPQVTGIDFWRTIRAYRVQLNLMRIHNLNSHNMRSFEIPAIGGIQLAPDTIEHRLLLPKTSNYLFSDLDSCVKICNQLFNTPLEQIKQIRNSARKEILHSNASYFYRAKYVYEVFNNLHEC